MQQPDRLGAKRILCPTVLFFFRECVGGGGGAVGQGGRGEAIFFLVSRW